MTRPPHQTAYHLLQLTTRCLATLLLISATHLSWGQFDNIISDYGIYHVHDAPSWGAGVSLVDINGDGKDDLTLATHQGENLRVYLQSPQTGQGLTPLTNSGILTSAYTVRSINWVDFDNDGDKDLFLTTAEAPPGETPTGRLLLFRNDGQLTFTEVSTEAGIADYVFASYGSSWSDIDKDGFADVLVNNYKNGPEGSNLLLHNNGDGTFTDMAEELALQDQQGISFTSIFFDANGDGTSDLFTANDRLPTVNRFYQGNPDGSFTDLESASGLEVNIEAMGVDIGDVDGDGDLDLYVTNTYGESLGDLGGGAYFRNEGDMTFTPLFDFPFGTNNATFWGCNMVDIDQDRDVDIFTVNAYGETGSERIKLFLNDGTGEFSLYEGSEFQAADGQHFGSAAGDINGDGEMDIVVLDRQFGGSQIWAGPATEADAVWVHLEGTISNRDAIGTFIETWVNGVRRVDQTTCGNSFSSQDSDHHPFGLGLAEQADSIILHWPSGVVNLVENIPAGSHLELIENETERTIDCIPSGEITLEHINQLDYMISLDNPANITTIEWLINDEVVDIEGTPIFTFPNEGTHTICINLRSPCTTVQKCIDVLIDCVPSTPEFAIEQSYFDLTATLSNSYDTLLWILDGDTIGDESVLDFTFSEEGDYTLCVSGSDICGSATECIDVNVSCPAPSSDFSLSADTLYLTFSDNALLSDSTQWLIDGLSIPLDANEGYLLGEEGEYEVCQVTMNPCGSDTLCESIFVSAVGLRENGGRPSPKVYPNPADQKISLVLPSKMLSADKVVIRDGEGRTVLTQAIFEARSPITIDIGNMADGPYVLELHEGQRLVSTATFIKSRSGN